MSKPHRRIRDTSAPYQHIDPSVVAQALNAEPAPQNWRPHMKSWSNPNLLQSISNPAPQLNYVITIKNSEVTLLGAKEQPDFAVVTIDYVPGKKIIELKSLKQYFHQFRNHLISYERFISVVFTDLMQTYEPQKLILTATFNTRGGMTSTLVVDSTNQPKA